MHKIWISGLLECVPYIAELFPEEPWLFFWCRGEKSQRQGTERAPELLSLSCLLRPDPSLNPFSIPLPSSDTELLLVDLTHTLRTQAQFIPSRRAYPLQSDSKAHRPIQSLYLRRIIHTYHNVGSRRTRSQRSLRRRALRQR